jgi:hypothetical protein
LKVARRKTQSKEEWDEKNQIKRREMVHFHTLGAFNLGSIQPWLR